MPPLADLEHPDWSPNGTWISFNIDPEAPHAAVMVVHPDGKGLRVVRSSDNQLGCSSRYGPPTAAKFLVGCHDFQAGSTSSAS